MSDSATIARPYAKAVFEHALSNKKLADWENYLHALSLIAKDEQALSFLRNPASTSEQQAELFSAVINLMPTTDQVYLKNFIQTLVYYKRLLVLPEIAALYSSMKATHEKMLSVNVKSFSELSSTQQNNLINSLSRRLNCEVTLNITIDKSLMGGAIINVDDLGLVIDGSVRGKLKKLRSRLAA